MGAVAKFTLAIKNPFNNEKADFINCVAWGKLAELLEKHGFKGQQLAVVGRLSIRKHEDKYYTEIIVEELEIQSWKKEGQADEWGDENPF